MPEVEQTDDPAKGRTMLDEALDLRGNFYFGAVGACCVGCAAWQRIFNLLPRWALTAACLSLVGTYTPWAFGQSLANLKSWGGAFCHSAMLLPSDKRTHIPSPVLERL